MRKILENIFLILLSIAAFIFLFIITTEFISSISKEYQYAIIGAMGSLIGGTFTLLGVWWTLRNQSKSLFIDEFPKKIRLIDQIKNKILKISESETLFKDLFYPNQSITYNRFVDDLKIDTTEVDGKSYFIVCKLESFFEDFYQKRKVIAQYETDIHDQFGRPVLTKKSNDELSKLIDEYKRKLKTIANELEKHGEKLTTTFFKYMGNK